MDDELYFFQNEILKIIKSVDYEFYKELDGSLEDVPNLARLVEEILWEVWDKGYEAGEGGY